MDGRLHWFKMHARRTLSEKHLPADAFLSVPPALTSAAPIEAAADEKTASGAKRGGRGQEKKSKWCQIVPSTDLDKLQSTV